MGCKCSAPHIKFATIKHTEHGIEIFNESKNNFD